MKKGNDLNTSLFGELKRVTWTSGKKLIENIWITIFFVLLLGGVIAVIDTAALYGIRELLKFIK